MFFSNYGKNTVKVRCQSYKLIILNIYRVISTENHPSINMAPKSKKLKRVPGLRKRKKKGAGPAGRSGRHALLEQALALQQAGRFPQAEVLYRQILAAEPNHAEALHYLGLLAYQVGQTGTAAELINRAISCRPGYVEAHVNLGITLKAQGKLANAVTSFQRALTLQPDEAGALYNLGLTLRAQGKLDEAIASFQKALTLQPDYSKARNSLGIALQEQGKLQESVGCFRRVLTLQPDYAEAHYNLGIALNSLGKMDEAAACFRRVLSLEPDYVEAHFNLGIISRSNKPDEAIDHLRQVLALKPDHVEAHFNLGIILNDLGKPGEAAASFGRALSLRPAYAEAHYNLGILFQGLGKHDEAIASYRQALIHEPDFAKAHHNLGVVFSELGRLDEAVACYRKTLALKPHFAETYKNLSAIVKYTEFNDDINAMEALYNKKGGTPGERIDLGFALGKVFGDLMDYHKSFDYILEANRLKRESFEYSIQKDHDLFERIKKTFSPDFFASHPGQGNQEGRPIFIIGMPRSGTTLVEQILASHPQVFGAGEVTVLKDLVDTLGNGQRTGTFPESILNLKNDAFAKTGSAYMEGIRKYAGNADYITDKMPDNFLRVGFIRIILPNAKIVHCTRHPMDICFSIFKNDFKGLFGYAYNMDELGRYYNTYRDLMAHWEKVLPGFMHSVKYEEMVMDQHKQTKNLLEFCGLPWDRACLQFHKTRRRVGTASLAQVRQPIYKDSVALWKRYEKQLEPMKKAIYG